jgi:hypothetical protein
MQGSTRVNKPLKIDTQVTSDDMDHLWGEVHKSRDGTAHVKVSKEVLTRLLLDHGNLLNYYSRTSIR